MDSRRACARVRLTDHTFMSTSECTLPRLKYQAQYQSLLDALHKVYGSSPPNRSDPLDAYPGARELLEERYSEEDTMRPSPEDALDYILTAAIDRFGYSARDVFSGVFNYDEMTWYHRDAFHITYTELHTAVLALSTNQNVDSKYHRILTLSTVYRGSLKRIRWDVDFKSDWVARNVIQKLTEEEDNVIHQQIRLVKGIPEARGLVGWLLEPLAYRFIANATDDIINSNGAGPRPGFPC